MTTPDLARLIGQSEGRNTERRIQEQLLAGLILDHDGESRFLGARIGIVWVDEKPPWADDWARSVLNRDGGQA